MTRRKAANLIFEAGKNTKGDVSEAFEASKDDPQFQEAVETISALQEDPFAMFTDGRRMAGMFGRA